MEACTEAEPIEPTDDEAKFIKALQRVCKRAPDSVWLYSAGGSLHVMRKGPDGGTVFTTRGYAPGEAVSQTHILGTIEGIVNSGGDW